MERDYYLIAGGTSSIDNVIRKVNKMSKLGYVVSGSLVVVYRQLPDDSKRSVPFIYQPMVRNK